MDNINIDISETNRGKEQVVVNKKYKFNLSSKRKDNSKVYKCVEYKTSTKCPSLIILNDKNEVLKYNSKHEHLEKEHEATISILKHKIKDEIRKNPVLFDVKPKRIFNKVSQEMGFICPEYDTIKSQITRNINKQLPSDITTFDEIPDESEYYKTKRNESFMIFKNHNLLIFQFQAELFSKYCEDVFVDGTFFIAPSISYQVFITRIYVKHLNSYYTTSFSILRNKEQETYEILLEEIKKNVSKYNNNTEITPKYFHCDFERGISNAAEKVFPNSNIKYCIWHYKRALEKQKNKLCFNEVDDNKDLYIYYKFISNLSFINPKYIYDIYNKILVECYEHNYVQFLVFLEYFKNTYLIRYETKYWNYYNNVEHITNNASESYNNYLKSLFPKKPTFYKLLYKLQEEESLLYNDYERRIGGIWKKKQKKIGRTNEINALIKYYKNVETLLEKNGNNRKDFIELWLKCLSDLNIKIIN